MATYANLKSKISLDSTEFKAGIRRVKLTAAAASKSIGRGFSSMGAGLSKVTGTLANLAKMLAKVAAIAAGITFAAAIAGAALLIKNLSGASRAAADFEQIRTTMTAFLGDAGKADKILAEISKFSTVTPFETSGLQSATSLLLGAGIAGEDVVDVIKEIAAVSKNTEQVSELGDALAKGFAKGKFQTEELNKFLERGINLMPALAQQTGKTGVELQKAIQAGLKFDDVRAAIASMSQEGGLFFNVLNKQSTTFIGLTSTLKSNWEEFQVQLGKPINDALKPLLVFGIETIQKMTAGAAGFGEAFAAQIEKLAAMVDRKFGSIDFAAVGQKFAAAFDPANISGTITKIGELTASVMSDALRISMEYGYAVLRGLLSAEGLAFIGDSVMEIFKTMGKALADTLFNVFDFVKDAFKKEPEIQQGSHETDADFEKRKAEERNFALDQRIGARNKKGEDDLGASFIKKLGEEIGSVDIGFSDKTKGILKDISSTSEGQDKFQKERDGIAAREAAAKRTIEDNLRKKATQGSQDYSNPFVGPSQHHGPPRPPQSVIDGNIAKNSIAAMKGQGFDGLAGLAQMQLDKGSGAGFSTNGATGGLGAVRRLKTSQDNKVEKKEDTLTATNQHLNSQIDLLTEQNALLREGLAS